MAAGLRDDGEIVSRLVYVNFLNLYIYLKYINLLN
jgi:hypothetical protein